MFHLKLKHFPPQTYSEFYEANEGHEAIATLASLPNTNIKVITQNIDGLHFRTRNQWNHDEQLIEAHGRLGLYKCIPDVDSDSDSTSDEDDENQQRKVYLGSRSRASSRLGTSRNSSNADSNKDDKVSICRYEFAESIPTHSIEPPDIRTIFSGDINQDGNVRHSVDSDFALALQLQGYINKSGSESGYQRHITEHVSSKLSTLLISEPPQCPSCRRPVMPQALQFDEKYHSHSHYQFERMEDWLHESCVFVFVGTSFAVTLAQHALEHAKEEKKIVYNLNIDGGVLESSSWMNVENIIGDVSITLPELVRLCEEEMATAG